ncbi:ribbon-helix-helix protein, CopG family [Stenotrophomonas sp. VV52]|uniref:ribbon-helix-helix protein, CopG family n=1 Tax=Stenotrophomonas sp. VV52 TaxID=2066958 RepID=UPI000C9DC7F3|nr:ribbon-helix-helix protein, CopG family [Stenotrophomonas sp. VV52]
MPRLIKPQSPQRLPKVLLPKAMHQALQVQASIAGVTIAEAVRQVLTVAITKPLSPSQGQVLGPRIALAPVSAPAELVARLKSRAWMEQVSVAEIVRRALNDFLTVPAPVVVPVCDKILAWGQYIHGRQWKHPETLRAVFESRLYLHPADPSDDTASAWNWVKACSPAQVWTRMGAPTPAELERVIQADTKARDALLAPRLELSEEETRRCFDVRLIAGLAMTVARKGWPGAPLMHGAYGRHWIIESTARKREDILLQDIGLRVWAETMAMKANRATQQAASDETRGSEGFLVTHEVGSC